MSSANGGSRAVDEARQFICREFARMLNAGAFTVRIRIARNGDGPAEAWFYSHRPRGWHKEPDAITDHELVSAIQETLDMLASREHTDEWSVRRSQSRAYDDTDVQFHREKLEHRLGEKLGSTLAGVLFRDSHDSKKDKRHAIRTPRSARPARK